MSLKDKITSLLFSPKPQLEEEEEFDTVQASVTEEVTQTQTNGILDQALLELPSEHPIHRLYDQRRKQSGYLPSPRICLDEDGVLPPRTAAAGKKSDSNDFEGDVQRPPERGQGRQE